MLPKKYRDKVRARLAKVKAIFSDEARVLELMRRIGGFEQPGGSSGLPEAMEQFKLLLNKDVPALLDALDSVVQQPKRISPLGQDRDP